MHVARKMRFFSGEQAALEGEIKTVFAGQTQDYGPQVMLSPHKLLDVSAFQPEVVFILCVYNQLSDAKARNTILTHSSY